MFRFPGDLFRAMVLVFQGWVYVLWMAARYLAIGGTVAGSFYAAGRVLTHLTGDPSWSILILPGLFLGLCAMYAHDALTTVQAGYDPVDPDRRLGDRSTGAGG
ncbi:MAG: hypothetical protein K2X87_00040 [Gemmataceae bacterium]|nr:hypothetical protein [Gemmataceae bacterium]